jgi:hypothetical protein
MLYRSTSRHIPEGKKKMMEKITAAVDEAINTSAAPS